MKMKVMKKGRTVNGDSFVEVDEKYDKELVKKSLKERSIPGIATAIAKAKKAMGYSDKPKVKPQNKYKKP